MESSVQKIYKKLNSGFFAFWVTNRKVSILLSLLILFLGVFSIFQIPKESSPEIEFGIVNIVTVYPGVGPVDMDQLITQEIEDAIKDIEGIDSISSSSRVGVASTTINLENGIDTSNFINEVRTEVDSVRLPDDAESPLVNEISPTENVIFQGILYGDETIYPKEAMIEIARTLKDELEGESYVSSVSIQGGSDYDLEVLLNKSEIEQIGLSIGSVAQTIRAYNRNIPIGSYEVDTFNYDFRIQGELESIQELLAIPLITEGFSVVTLGDVSTLRRGYDNESITKLGGYDKQGFNAVTVSVSKSSNVNIFDASTQTKEYINTLLTSQSFEGIQIAYANDLADNIREDYKMLQDSGVQTFIFVFLCLLLFVGVKEALVANLGIILAFCITFIVLNNTGYTLNFLTNFSLILSLGIAIDTSIVVIEAAYERIKLGFTPKTASLLAVRDFKAPLIAGTSTTLVVFIPMMVLPGITGKFLAYIPITVFITLLAALFVALTINVAWFYKLSKNEKKYIKSPSLEKFLSREDTILLAKEREGKIQETEQSFSDIKIQYRTQTISGKETIRDGNRGKGIKKIFSGIYRIIIGFKERLLESLNSWYEQFLINYLKNDTKRRMGVILPFYLTVVTTIILGPILGFTLFPAGDNGRLDFTITGPTGQTTETMNKRVTYIEPTLTQYTEIEQYDLRVNGNTISVGIELTDKDERQAEDMFSVFELEESINKSLAFLIQEGLELESRAQEGGPPQGKSVAIKLIAQRGDQFSELLGVASQFEEYLKGVEGTRNVGISSQRTPGQFIYEYNTASISRLGITPLQAAGDIASALNGTSAGALTIDNEERTIRVLLDEFANEVSPTDIGNIVVQTPNGPVSANEFISYRIDNAVAEISRDDEKITISVQSDLKQEFIPRAGVINAAFAQRALQQELPDGISFEKGGEGEDSADLINAAVQGLVISLFLIIGILVLQFNSFTKPLVILFSVVCALLGVNIGLYLTGNPYSMPMGIGFIALTGIVVNDAIVLLDRIKENNKHGAIGIEAITEAGRSRLQPIILTTITTLLGVLPISLQDEFWAGLGFTMIFGLFAGSALTLTAIPSLYAIFFVSRDRLSYKAMQRAWTISKQQYFSHILPVLGIIMVGVIGFLSSMAEPFVGSILFYIILGITSILLGIASFWLYKKIYKSYNTKPLISSVTLFVRNFITTIMSYILIGVVGGVGYGIIYGIMYLWKLSYSTVEYYWQEVIDWVYGMVGFDLIIIDLSILTSVLSVTLYTIVGILLVYILIKISYAVIDVFMGNGRGIGSLKRSWSYTSNKRRQVFEIRGIQFIGFIVTLLPLGIAYGLYNAFENQYFLLLGLVSLILIILYIPFVFGVDIIFYSNFNNQYIDIKHKRVDK